MIEILQSYNASSLRNRGIQNDVKRNEGNSEIGSFDNAILSILFCYFFLRFFYILVDLFCDYFY